MDHFVRERQVAKISFWNLQAFIFTDVANNVMNTRRIGLRTITRSNQKFKTDFHLLN